MAATRDKRLRAIARVLGVNVVVALVLLEIGLRLQQRLGPLYDLDYNPEVILKGQSNELNHVHIPGPRWDANGIRRMTGADESDCGLKVLFMGDSFMEGLGIDDTIPVHVKDYFKRERHQSICVFNAGCTSYSPTIYIPQAKKLIPAIGPDLVVIDIDETDLFDDYYRYRALVVRDGSGAIAGVKASPIAFTFHDGLQDVRNKPFYLYRLLAKLYFTQVAYPAAYARSIAGRPTTLDEISGLPAGEERRRYAVELEYFETTLDELTRTVIERMGSPDRLIYLHHPHLGHVAVTGTPYNHVLVDAIREVASRHGVRFYDATDDLKMEFAGTPDKYYIPDDMHFNALGLRTYGLAIARYLAVVVRH